MALESEIFARGTGRGQGLVDGLAGDGEGLLPVPALGRAIVLGQDDPGGAGRVPAVGGYGNVKPAVEDLGHGLRLRLGPGLDAVTDGVTGSIGTKQGIFAGSLLSHTETAATFAIVCAMSSRHEEASQSP